ncbi:MAG: glycosyl hydrolase [Anaerovorax sp.]
MMGSLGLLLLVSLNFFACTGTAPSSKPHVDTGEASSFVSPMYDVEKVGVTKAKITNKVDGYSIVVPKDMKVDLSMSEIRMVLENKHERVEIYRQELDPAVGITLESYTAYSNKFLENTVDYTTEFAQTIRLAGKDMVVAQWSRAPLQRVKDDKNHYASVDVAVSEKECVTFLFKSSKPYEKAGKTRSYLDVLNTFRCVEKTAAPQIETIPMRENSHWNAQTKDTFQQYFGKEAKLTWGIFEKEAPLDFENLNSIESKLEFRFPILLYYTGFIEGEDRHPRLEKALKNAGEEDRLLELTLQTLGQDESKGNMVYDVLNGNYDTYLKNYGAEIKAYGKPILFRVGNEMNGDWCVYSAYHTGKDTEIYKAFYTYIYTIFQEVGVDNVIWIWNPNARSFPDFKWNHELCYFPGNAYVDVVGMTAYNTGTYYEGELWESFSQLYDETYESYARKYKLPLMITEFASSSVGGDKAKWITQMFQHMKTYDHLKVALWWSNCDLDGEGNIARPYFIDESDEILDAFREGLREYK